MTESVKKQKCGKDAETVQNAVSKENPYERNGSFAEIRTGKLKSFKNHPFRIANDEEMRNLCDSIREYGVLSPLIVRKATATTYEIISGHRRKAAAELIGLDKLPCFVRELTDDEATILVVDSNIQRENILPSEKAFAYKMKLEALKRQGKRNDLTSCQLDTKPSYFRSDNAVAAQSEDSARTVQRYIRLTNLIKPLLDMVDEKMIAFTPAVELSYLSIEKQTDLWHYMQEFDCTPSLSQAVHMKKLYQNKKLGSDTICLIMSQLKPNQIEHVRLSTDELKDYFPASYTTGDMKKAIIKLIEENIKK